MHLGDCFVHTHFMNELSALAGCGCVLYCNKDYHSECRNIVFKPDLITFKPIDECTDQALNCGVGPYLRECTQLRSKIIPGQEHVFSNHLFNGLRPYEMDYGQFYLDWFDKFTKHHSLPNPITTMRSLAVNIPNPDADPNGLVKDCQFLIINAPSRVDEFEFNAEDWDGLIGKLMRAGKKVVCTHPNKGGVVSTLELGWSLADIGRQAMHSEVVIGVHTSPMWAAMNRIAIDSVKYWLVFTRGHYFTFTDKFRWSRTWEWGMRMLNEDRVV